MPCSARSAIIQAPKSPQQPGWKQSPEVMSGSHGVLLDPGHVESELGGCRLPPRRVTTVQSNSF